MKTIIAGSRSLTDYALVEEACKNCGWTITEVVSGCAPGIDRLGEVWATHRSIPVKRFAALWKNLKAPGAVIRTGPYGKYNARAGLDRNRDMAEYAQALIAIWNGISTGTADMIESATKKGLRVFVTHPTRKSELSFGPGTTPTPDPLP